ncbi:MAG: putative bifunctional diguanylate cyclase/phosphodiesterase [Acidimicrobiales bacterium]
MASLIPLIALAFFLSHELRNAIERRASAAYLANAETMFDLMAHSLLQPTDFDGVLDEGRQKLFDDLLSKAGPPDRVRVRLVARSGTVVYSTANRETASVLDIGPQAAKALAGTPNTRLSDGKTGSIIPGQRQIELYIPVEMGGQIVGVVEAAGIDPDLLNNIEGDIRRMHVMLAAGLALLWLVLLPIVASVSRRLRRQAQENAYLAMHDTLTGLPNRNLLQDRLRCAIGDATRGRTLVGLLLIDLDRFKDVNDTLGHSTGDALLQMVSRRLVQSIRPSDTVARLGGDEFAVVVADQVTEEAIAQIAERVTGSLREPFDVGGFEVSVDASIGVAIHPTHSYGAEQLLQHADIAMYAAKDAGADHLFYSPDIDSNSPLRLALAADLRRALTYDEGQITVYFQPEASPETGQVKVLEALARWHHPVRGMVAPLDFIPLAEQSGLIRLLTARVLDLAIAQIRTGIDQGYSYAVAVNLSARDLADHMIVEQITAILRANDVPPRLLEVEVTETAVLADPDTAVAVLGELRAMGIKVALDDFGTGYSSLTYLKRLAPDRVKVDKTFVDAMLHERADESIITSLIQLAHTLDMEVTAEGVETTEQWNHLASQGCDLIQGYLLSRPLPIEAVDDWVAQHALANVVPTHSAVPQT